MTALWVDRIKLIFTRHHQSQRSRFGFVGTNVLIVQNLQRLYISQSSQFLARQITARVHRGVAGWYCGGSIDDVARLYANCFDVALRRLAHLRVRQRLGCRSNGICYYMAYLNI